MIEEKVNIRLGFYYQATWPVFIYYSVRSKALIVFFAGLSFKDLVRI